MWSQQKPLTISMYIGGFIITGTNDKMINNGQCDAGKAERINQERRVIEQLNGITLSNRISTNYDILMQSMKEVMTV